MTDLYTENNSFTLPMKRPRKARSIKSFVEYEGGDWIISGKQAADIIDILLKSKKSDASSLRILLPGVGYSNLPRGETCFLPENRTISDSKDD